MNAKMTKKLTDAELINAMLEAAESAPFTMNGDAFNTKFDEIIAQKKAAKK